MRSAPSWPAGQVLTACPHVRILATSREPLAITGEALWTVGPLTLPPDPAVTFDQAERPAVPAPAIDDYASVAVKTGRSAASSRSRSLLRVQGGGETRRHIPDYLLLTDSGPVVVDVKPRHRLARPEVAATFGWTRALVEARGRRYEVRCEPPGALLENVRFLAGYRRDWPSPTDSVSGKILVNRPGTSVIRCPSRPLVP